MAVIPVQGCSPNLDRELCSAYTIDGGKPYAVRPQWQAEIPSQSATSNAEGSRGGGSIGSSAMPADFCRDSLAHLLLRLQDTNTDVASQDSGSALWSEVSSSSDVCKFGHRKGAPDVSLSLRGGAEPATADGASGSQGHGTPVEAPVKADLSSEHSSSSQDHASRRVRSGAPTLKQTVSKRRGDTAKSCNSIRGNISSSSTLSVHELAQAATSTAHEVLLLTQGGDLSHSEAAVDVTANSNCRAVSASETADRTVEQARAQAAEAAQDAEEDAHRSMQRMHEAEALAKAANNRAHRSVRYADASICAAELQAEMRIAEIEAEIEAEADAAVRKAQVRVEAAEVATKRRAERVLRAAKEEEAVTDAAWSSLMKQLPEGLAERMSIMEAALEGCERPQAGEECCAAAEALHRARHIHTQLQQQVVDSAFSDNVPVAAAFLVTWGVLLAIALDGLLRLWATPLSAAALGSATQPLMAKDAGLTVVLGSLVLQPSLQAHSREAQGDCRAADSSAIHPTALDGRYSTADRSVAKPAFPLADVCSLPEPAGGGDSAQAGGGQRLQCRDSRPLRRAVSGGAATHGDSVAKRMGAPAIDLPTLSAGRHIDLLAPASCIEPPRPQHQTQCVQEASGRQGMRSLAATRAEWRRTPERSRAVSAQVRGVREPPAAAPEQREAQAADPRQMVANIGNEAQVELPMRKIAEGGRCCDGDTSAEDTGDKQVGDESATDPLFAALPSGVELALSAVEVGRSMAIEKARVQEEIRTLKLQRHLLDSKKTPDQSAGETQRVASPAANADGSQSEAPTEASERRMQPRSSARSTRSASPVSRDHRDSQRRPLYNTKRTFSPPPRQPRSSSPFGRVLSGRPLSPSRDFAPEPQQAARGLPTAMLPYLHSSPALMAAAARWGPSPPTRATIVPARPSNRVGFDETEAGVRTRPRPCAPVRACHSLSRLHGFQT